MNIGAKILIGILLVECAIFMVVFLKDVYKHRETLKGTKRNFILNSIISCIATFFDVLGIGNCATITIASKFCKSLRDEEIPGTLNCGLAIPVAVEAIAFIGRVSCDAKTLVLMIISSVIGGLVGVKIISKLSLNAIRTGLGSALLVMAVVVFCKNSGVGPFGIIGTATGLAGFELIIAICVMFVFGGFQSLGLGIYAPCMGLVLLLGMDTTVAFPIMMGSAAYILPSIGISFVKEGMYDRSAAISFMIFGSIGAVIALVFVTSLPIKTLTYIVCVVMIIAAATFFKDVIAEKNNK